MLDRLREIRGKQPLLSLFQVKLGRPINLSFAQTGHINKTQLEAQHPIRDDREKQNRH